MKNSRYIVFHDEAERDEFMLTREVLLQRETLRAESAAWARKLLLMLRDLPATREVRAMRREARAMLKDSQR